MITMSVSARIYYACQLDDGSIRSHYGLTRVPSNGRRGKWFTGPEAAWRKLADDGEMRAMGGWDPRSCLYPSESLHARITKAASKAA